MSCPPMNVGNGKAHYEATVTDSCMSITNTGQHTASRSSLLTTTTLLS